MNAQPRDYKVTPDGETARLLREAAASAAPIRVDTGAVVYEVGATATPKPYDPQAMLRAIEAGAGVLRDVDADALLQRLREDRRQNSGGRPADE